MPGSTRTVSWRYGPPPPDTAGRALWYEATDWEVTNLPAKDTLTLLEAGNALEPVVLRAMVRSG